ncbi:MAG: HupE/UreJ family protein [Crocinitomicaceae bacterium]|nr:HupE/UreJ family protein [Crocinitomicaceae bacterium]
MNNFSEGIRHILDPHGYDHILFILAFVAGYRINQWKRVVLLATAFTMGHSLTLGLAALDIFRLSSSWVEFFIPITIFLTALSRIVRKSEKTFSPVNYLVTALFGLVHGLGFSSYFRMLYEGTSDIVRNLLLFNCGVEAGQLLVIAFIIAIQEILILTIGLHLHTMTRVIMIFILLVSCWMMVEKFP